MTCSWKLMIVNLWDAASAFCCTIIRMLWLWITLYSNWIFYGNYTQICFVFDLYIWFFSTPCHIGLYSSYVINLFCFFWRIVLFGAVTYMNLCMLLRQTHVVVIFPFGCVFIFRKLTCSLFSWSYSVAYCQDIAEICDSYVMRSTVLPE